MKKLIAIFLVITLMFSFMAVPASAKVGNLGESDPSFTESVTVSVFDKIGDFFHDLIAKIFGVFGADCPLCDNHYGYGEAEGEGGYTKEEVAKMYNDAINNLKKYNLEVRIDHSKEIKAEVTEEAALPSIRKMVNDILKALTAGRVESGKDYSYNSQSQINALIPPSNKESALSGANVTAIKANKINDTIKIEFTLKDVDAYYENSVTTNDAVYASVLNPINFAALDLGKDITVNSANISYRNVKVTAVLDSYGRIISFNASTEFTVSVTADASTGFSTTVAGTIAEEFEVKY